MTTFLNTWKSAVIGQDNVLDIIYPYLETYNANLSPPNRPIGVFLLAGSTGVGKTYTVQSLAKQLHDSEKTLLRIDCAEFSSKHEVARLIGAPPGYIGHNETQPLLAQQGIEAVTSNKSPISIILLDEIEKAHPDFYRIFLGAFDSGSIRLSTNKTADMTRCMFFMTSNLGTEEYQNAQNTYQFHSTQRKDISSYVNTAIKKRFSPEFINRIDEVCIYNALTNEQFSEILTLEIKKLQRHIHDRRLMYLHIDDGVKQFLLNKCNITTYGAREIKRILHRYITHPLSSLVGFASDPKSPKIGSQINCYVENDNVNFNITQSYVTAAMDAIRSSKTQKTRKKKNEIPYEDYTNVF